MYVRGRVFDIYLFILLLFTLFVLSLRMVGLHSYGPVLMVTPPAPPCSWIGGRLSTWQIMKWDHYYLNIHACFVMCVGVHITAGVYLFIILLKLLYINSMFRYTVDTKHDHTIHYSHSSCYLLDWLDCTHEGLWKWSLLLRLPAPGEGGGCRPER